MGPILTGSHGWWLGGYRGPYGWFSGAGAFFVPWAAPAYGRGRIGVTALEASHHGELRRVGWLNASTMLCYRRTTPW